MVLLPAHPVTGSHLQETDRNNFQGQKPDRSLCHSAQDQATDQSQLSVTDY